MNVIVIGNQKGRTLRERTRRNFGMARPEGYRKALRLMKLAEKFGLPVITFVDTPGAYPGIDAEERGQSEAIGHNIYAMSTLNVPIVSCVIGEGGSGGALAIAVADTVMMLQYSTYSVISPEGCASILFKDCLLYTSTPAARADSATALSMTSKSRGFFGASFSVAHFLRASSMTAARSWAGWARRLSCQIGSRSTARRAWRTWSRTHH